jgi:hypothetical protein
MKTRALPLQILKELNNKLQHYIQISYTKFNQIWTMNGEQDFAYFHKLTTIQYISAYLYRILSESVSNVDKMKKVSPAFSKVRLSLHCYQTSINGTM